MTSVLIVEDEAIIALSIRATLRDMGIVDASVARSGEEAVEKARALRPRLLLMDINLGPGMDGIEAARRIQAQQDIAVVFVSAFSDAAVLQKAQALGPLGYLAKPLDAALLQALLAQLPG